jgi:hypothetical protein
MIPPIGTEGKPRRTAGFFPHGKICVTSHALVDRMLNLTDT